MSPQQKPKTPKLLFASALVLGSLAFNSLNAFAATPIDDMLEKTPIADRNFATCIASAYLQETGESLFDALEDFTLESYATELAKIATLNCENKNISDVTGLEMLTGLKDLRLTSNSIEEIDVSALTDLETLYITYNPIEYIDLMFNTNLKTFFSNQTTPNNIQNSAWVLTPAQPTRNNDKVIMDFSIVKFLYSDSTHYCSPIDTEKFSFDAATGIVTVLDEDAISSSPINLSCSNGTFIALYHLFRDYMYNYYFDGKLDYDKSGHEYALMGDTFLADDFAKDIEGYELESYDFWDDEVSVGTERLSGLLPRKYYHNADEFTFGPYTRYAGIILYYKSEAEPEKEETPEVKTPNTGFFTNEDGGVNVTNLLLVLAGLSVAVFLGIGTYSRIKKHAKVSRF